MRLGFDAKATAIFSTVNRPGFSTHAQAVGIDSFELYRRHAVMLSRPSSAAHGEMILLARECDL